MNEVFVVWDESADVVIAVFETEALAKAAIAEVTPKYKRSLLSVGGLIPFNELPLEL